MRIAVLIIGLLLGLLMFLQTFLVAALDSASTDTSDDAAIGAAIVMTILWLVACAFVLPYPFVSVVIFVLVGALGFGFSGNYPDLAMWGVVALFLAVLSFIGWRGKIRDKREAVAERLRQLERDDRLETLLRQQRDQVRFPKEPT